MKVLRATLLLFGWAIATPVTAAGVNDALVACAWSKAPATAATLTSRVKFDGEYRYDADGSPTVGPLMRVFAACANEKAALVAARKYDERSFLKQLRKAKPTIIGADVFAERVFRCEGRFRDDALAPEPASISWGYGQDLSTHQLRLTTTVSGSVKTVSSTALKDDRALLALIQTAQAASDRAIQVENRKDGEASGQPYVIKNGGGHQTCQVVQSDGSYVDA